MQLAQINIATLKFPLDDPRVAEFVDNLDTINSLAENSLGFVWRLKEENGNATSISVFENPLTIVNMSVWQDTESLNRFTYHSAHTPFISKRKDWFELPSSRHFALWWITPNRFPDAAEGRKRVEYLQKNGPTSLAFTFKRQFSADCATQVDNLRVG